MGSDSIDPELFRLPITAFSIRLDTPLQLLLYALLEPSITQRPCFVGGIADFIQAAFGDVCFEELAVGGLTFFVGFAQAPLFQMRGDEVICLSQCVAAVARPRVFGGVRHHVCPHGI